MKNFLFDSVFAVDTCNIVPVNDVNSIIECRFAFYGIDLCNDTFL